MPNGLHVKGGNAVTQNHVILLLRQISSSLPGDAGNRPEEISELSFAQIALLSELFELEKTGREPLSLSTLSRETGFSKATVCAALKKLRKAGFVQTQMDDADNRRKEIVLTQRAWEAQSSVGQYISAVDRTLCAGIAPKDLQTTEQSLSVILQNTKRSEGNALE